MGLTQPSHLIILIAIIVLLFGGATRLPEFGKALGSGMREFKDAVSGNNPPRAEQPPAELPPAEPAVAATTAAPSEHDTTV